MDKHENKFDVIIIGSGIGGLTCASLLAKLENKRVLVLEKKPHIGGYTNEIRSQANYVWETGIQAVGQVEPESMNRAMFNFITNGELDWVRLPEVYSKLVYPTFRFNVSSGEENFRNSVIKQFPSEAEKITEYFHDIKIAAKWFNRNRAITSAAPDKIKNYAPADTPLDSLALSTVGEYMRNNFRSPQLKALLSANWISYGLPPSEASFAIHAAVVNHYINGAYYPLGGSKSISSSLVLPVIHHGGIVLTHHSVEKLIVENDTVTGVSTIEQRANEPIKRDYFADLVISNIGARNTYNYLLANYISNPMKEEINNFPHGPVTINLYLALHRDPRELGFSGENIWIFNSLDNDENFKNNCNLTKGNCGGIMLTFPSLKLKNTQKHTAMIATIGDIDDFRNWIGKPHKNKAISLRILESDISDLMINMVERKFPGFQSTIGFRDLSLPVDLETGEYIGGNVFGFPAIPAKFKANWFHPETPLKNFYLTGSDISGHGVVGGMLSGAVTLNSVLNLPINLFRIFRDAKVFNKDPE